MSFVHFGVLVSDVFALGNDNAVCNGVGGGIGEVRKAADARHVLLKGKGVEAA